MPMLVSNVGPDEVLMTTPQTAAYLQVHVSTLGNWRRAGIGPEYVRFGSHYRYRKSAVDAWFEDQRQPHCAA